MNTDPIWAHSQAEGIDRLVLLAIAHEAGDNGAVTMHVRAIADKARLADRTVQKVLRRLVELGELDVLVGRGRTHGSTYRVLIGETQERADETRPPGREFGSPLVVVDESKTRHRLRAIARTMNGNGAA